MHSADRASSEAIPVEVVKPVTVAQCHEVIEAQARQIEMLRQCVAQQGEQLALAARAGEAGFAQLIEAAIIGRTGYSQQGATPCQ
jgi:hypothetical protein